LHFSVTILRWTDDVAVDDSGRGAQEA
jgi:hypothetical protein